MILKLVESLVKLLAFPRTRGDDPEVVVNIKGNTSFSPHPRG